jgi:L-seryl-tRNA(Ser) seleniumtransferase
MASPRDLPDIHGLLSDAALAVHRARLGRAALKRLAQDEVARARAGVLAGGECATRQQLIGRIAERARGSPQVPARRVINATGVILHTNLGRAPLSSRAQRALEDTAGRYASIELDLETGARGGRGAFAEAALAELSGAEAALVVNNNAAAVLLALATLARGRSVVISRGELVEIGGGFRIPEILARSGATLVEVGTTNRTRAQDYADALASLGPGALVLRVHPANFRQIGFVAKPELRALTALARAHGALLVDDLGSGALVDLTSAGLQGEPLVRESVAAGADAVCFSTDKLLGGPQGGAIVGRAELLADMRRDPMARALRLGRLPLVALEATLASYLEGDLDAIPVLAALRLPPSAARARAERWRSELMAAGLSVEIVELDAAAGGGALPEQAVPSWGVAIAVGDIMAMSRRLRVGDPPILARIRDQTLLLDARSVLPDEDSALLRGVLAALT